MRNFRDPSSRVLNLDDSPRVGQPATTSSTDTLRNIYRDGDKYRRTAERRRNEIAETLRHKTVSDQYLRQMPRHWKAGDVYAPRDLGPAEVKKWKTRRRPQKDVIDMLGVNPLDLYRVRFNSSPTICLSWSKEFYSLPFYRRNLANEMC